MNTSGLSSVVERGVLLAALGAVLVAGGHAARAQSSATARDAFARALTIEPALVTDATEYGVNLRPSVFGVLLGRHVEKGSRWEFPALVVYHACPTGSCMTSVSLGSAAKRLAPAAVVDLDAARTAIDDPQRGLQAVTHHGARQELAVPTKASWPALAIAVERDVSDRQQTDLVLVSLRTADRFQKLAEIPLLRRSPEPRDGPPMPSYARLGFEVERVVLRRDGDRRRIIATSRAFLPSTSGCPAPRPEERTYSLEGDRYQEVPGAPSSSNCP